VRNLKLPHIKIIDIECHEQTMTWSWLACAFKTVDTFTAGLCRRKLEVTFDGAPGKCTMDLVGSINYPNAEISEHDINFGSVLVDVHKSKEAFITNTSEVPVQYRWELKLDDGASPLSRQHDNEVAVNQLFDIKPIQGFLNPGEQEPVLVSYFAYGGHPAAATAVLHVSGGPDCLVRLKGVPNSMSFQLEPQSIDCGQCLYTSQINKEVTLINSGRCVKKNMFCGDFQAGTTCVCRQS
jgi:hydrocephalus-inducing protein